MAFTKRYFIAKDSADKLKRRKAKAKRIELSFKGKDVIPFPTHLISYASTNSSIVTEWGS
jgi:hypothetical protein